MIDAIYFPTTDIMVIYLPRKINAQYDHNEIVGANYKEKKMDFAIVDVDKNNAIQSIEIMNASKKYDVSKIPLSHSKEEPVWFIFVMAIISIVLFFAVMCLPATAATKVTETRKEVVTQTKTAVKEIIVNDDNSVTETNTYNEKQSIEKEIKQEVTNLPQENKEESKNEQKPNDNSKDNLVKN